MTASSQIQATLYVGLDAESSAGLDQLLLRNHNSKSTRETRLLRLINGFDGSTTDLALPSGPPDVGVKIARPQGKILEYASKLQARLRDSGLHVGLSAILRGIAEHEIRKHGETQKVWLGRRIECGGRRRRTRTRVAIAGVPVSA